jgi:tryptophanase
MLVAAQNTQSHIDYVAEAILEVAANKDALRGYRITSSAKRLRHFTAEFALLENIPASQHDEALAFAG